MEYPLLLLVAFIISTVVLYLLKSSPKSKLPPGPKPWPIIGNMHLLGSKPHDSVTKLCKRYGPLMRLKLGSETIMVISSPEVAKEMFLKHDATFSSRKTPDSFKIIGHDKASMVWNPVGPRWRNLRKISAIQLFTNQRLDATQDLRRDKVCELIQFVKNCCERGLAVEIGKAAFTTTLNLLSNTFFSMDMSSYDSSSTQEFKELVWIILQEGARPNVSDFFPLIRLLDLQGVRRRAKHYLIKMRGIFERIIAQRMKDQTSTNDDVLGTLLKLVKQNELSLLEVKHLLIDLFIAGTDTTSSTLEWAMTELLRHPDKMAKAQAEIDQVLNNDNSRLMQESDISRLPYIQAIVKETLRLHPPAAFLVPRSTNMEAELCGYYVPKNTTVWVNVWSMGRDPNIWPNAESFSPERFLGSEIDVKGRHFELIPFGAGRRICPGMSLGYRMVHLLLATLLHTFNWKLEDQLKSEDIDMEEMFGITLQKVQPLKVIPVPR